jgi:hypothetical protein
MGVRLIRSFCVLGLGLGACVKPFSGSSVQLDFTSSTQAITSAGKTALPLQPAADTMYGLYAVQDSIDAAGVTSSYVFPVQNFEIKPLLDITSPCFIDLEGTRFPGLHVTQIANKVSEQTGVADPFNPPPNASDGDISDVLTARKRIENLTNLQSVVKAVVSTSTFKYGPSAVACIEDTPSVDQTMFPPPTCTGDKSNALRLKLCKAVWAKNPDFYEGSDKVFTLPLNGTYYGTVEGTNPINNGFVGGSSVFVDESLTNIDRYFIAWQYKDMNGDGQPDIPDGTPDADKPYGHLYMAGTPRHIARGATSVTLVNPSDTSIGANMTIFPDLANDGTHF